MTSFRPPAPASEVDRISTFQRLRSAYRGVHAEQIGGKQRRLLTAGAAADLEHDVLVVVRVLRQKEDLACRSASAVLFAGEARLFLTRHGAHVGILLLEEDAVLFALLLDQLVATVGADQLDQVGVLFRELLELVATRDDVGIGELGFELDEAGLDCVKLVEHRRVGQEGGVARDAARVSATQPETGYLRPYFFWKRSMRPAVSISFCLPV